MNKSVLKYALNLTLVALASSLSIANAADAELRIESDLMIHPDQMANFFTIGANTIKSSPNWSWQNMQFTKPYKTAWSDVSAVGPFDIQFDTSDLKNQNFGFELTWNDPRITIGGFEIHDVATRVVGGIPVIFHLDGTCSNMTLQIPNGGWKIRGHMRWDFASNQFILSWNDFNLQTNTGAQPQVDIGNCQGPTVLFTTLHDAIVTMAQDQSWLTDVLKQGALDWLQTTMVNLQVQLLQARNIQVSKDIALAWQPSSLVTWPGGMIRVAGEFAITKPGATSGGGLVQRDYDPAKVFPSVTQSGFIMPTNSLQKLLGYMYSNGELQYRVDSSKVSAFQQLMQNRFLQFFVWPDLLRFATKTLFYFDLTTGIEPQLTDGHMLSGGGSVYNVTGPLLVHQWAPSPTAYLPYIDFTGAMNGQVYATLKNGNLSLTSRLSSLNVSASFRREFQSVRGVATYIATSLLGSSAKSFIESTPVKLVIPDWDFDHGMSIGLSDLQAWKDSFRVPLEFKSKPAQ